MTDVKWLKCEDPEAMLTVLQNKVSDRKLRLFACACCHRIAHFVVDDRSRTAIAILEQYADGQASDEQLVVADEANQEMLGRSGTEAAHDAATYTIACAVGVPQDGPSAVDTTKNARLTAHGAAGTIAIAPDRTQSKRAQQAARKVESRAQAVLLRDIFGNPFRPVAFAPEWRTDTAVSLGRQMYDAREFSAMPILADALQDAGCDDDDILQHCRDANQPHVRGCWVVDLVLGKE
jgi:hypothetical protein